MFDNENEGLTIPAQNSKGDILVASDLGRVYKINPRALVPNLIFTEPSGNQLRHAVKLDANYNIYVCTDNILYCLDSLGNKKWNFDLPGNKKFVTAIPAIDVDRNMVYISYADSGASKCYLGCLSRTTGPPLIAEREWPGIPVADTNIGSPSIAEDGTVYIGCYTKLYALNPLNLEGAPKWDVDLAPSWVGSITPIVGADGTVYFTYRKQVGGPWSIALGAFNQENGNLKWEKSRSVNGPDDQVMQGYATRNNVVILTFQLEGGDYSDSYELYAYRDDGTDGTELWNKSLEKSGGNLAFGPGSTLYAIPGDLDGTIIHAISEGDIGDPDGGGMGFTNNNAPNEPTLISPPDDTNKLDYNVWLFWACNDPEAHNLKYSVFVGESGYDIFPVATNINESVYSPQFFGQN